MSFIPMYAVTIQKAVASGDVKQMEDAVKNAEHHLSEYGDVGAALAVLKIEIAKLKK